MKYELLMLHITPKGRGRLAHVLLTFRIAKVIAELLEEEI
jgi:hypothetical protein